MADPSVDYAARGTYDAAYRGTGNWPFNAAYAARFNLDAFVTQLRSLAEAEQFVRAGIPLVASIASRPGEPKKVFLKSGEDVFVAGEGEMVDRRYKVIRISATSVEIQDVVNSGPPQSIPLTQG